MRKHLFILLSLFLVISCKKDTANITHPIVGLWQGTYSVDQVPSQGNQYFSFIIKPDGTLLTESKGGNGLTYYGVGNWTLTGSVFAYTLTSTSNGVQQSGQLTNNTAGSLTSGTWHDTNNSPNLSGTFPTMNRIN